MDEERLESLRELEKGLGYPFKEIEWLDRALTHKSYMHESPRSNPILQERMGTRSWSSWGMPCLVSPSATFSFRQFPEAQEGTLSKQRSHLVKRSFLSHLSRELHLESTFFSWEKANSWMEEERRRRF